MSEPTATLDELVEVLNDGIALFEQASENCRASQHTDLFQRIGRMKAIIAADLKAEIALNGGEPSSHGSWLGSVRQSYTDLRAKLARNPEQSYIDALEEQEDRVLAAFRTAANAAHRSRAGELAATYLPEVQRMHDELRKLKVEAGVGS